jgi:hypothetical protein
MGVPSGISTWPAGGDAIIGIFLDQAHGDHVGPNDKQVFYPNPSNRNLDIGHHLEHDQADQKNSQAAG